MHEQALIREEIEQAISQEPRISGRIDVEVHGRDVRLTGVVETLEQRELAEEIARSFGPVRIDNDIVIESTKVIEDEDVLAAARRAIAKNPDLAHDIGVDRVVDGIVYLKGHSPSLARIEEAVETVAEAAGVKDVVSEVKMMPGVSLTDDEIADEVAQALMANHSIHAEFLGVQAKHGIVTLSGAVANPRQKIIATSIAKQMPGVVEVINNLEVGEQPTSLDQAIENEVIKALELSDINMAGVRVNVLDGVVYLDGKVDTYKQKDRAEFLARNVKGVRMVQNDLVIGFHIEPKAG
ncbi:MAG: BON domain-containing protein [Firmicutes bacterium]|nr:BON domain-containing protein [Bacillota bacterium]